MKLKKITLFPILKLRSVCIRLAASFDYILLALVRLDVIDFGVCVCTVCYVAVFKGISGTVCVL